MNTIEIITVIALSGFAYISGSIPCGVILTRHIPELDIRRNGSGNIGAANVKRTAGIKTGLLTLTGDLLKGALPVFLASIVIDRTDDVKALYLSVVTLAAFSGHLYPLFLKFQNGGKGVATAAGCFLVLSPAAFCASILIYLLSILLTRRASLGSLFSSAALPLFVWLSTHSLILAYCAALTAAWIYLRHKDNIKRLLSGTEPPIWGAGR